MKEIQSIEMEFKELLKEQNAYKESLTLLQWDSHTSMSTGGVDNRAEVVGYLSTKMQQSETSEQMKYFIDALKNNTTDEIIKKTIDECEAVYERNRKIPEKEYKDYVMLCSKSESVWQEARMKSDYTLFEPYLERIVEYKKRFSGYWGYTENAYDGLLEVNEPGITTEVLDQVFPELRTSLTNLIDKVKSSPVKSDSSILITPFSTDKQKELSVAILKKMGYRFDNGRLDTSVHPYSFAINRNDVRLSTKYDENDFRMAVFSAIHEGGHALYEQNIGENLKNTPLSAASSMGMHESQSLYWETFVGKSRPFLETNFEAFKSYAPDHFKNIAFGDFHLALHEVKSSFIRIEADELTYPMHIMVRYELEKALMNGELKVRDLPHIWNEKMSDYLGIIPPSDREGILQDIHWSSGDFGYFPSYTLGYMYAAQLHNTLKKEINFDECIKNNDQHSIKQWFTENIHQYGKMKKPLEMLEDITKERLNPKYLVDFLTNKYTDLYKL